MALDPNIIAALSAGAKSTSTTQDWDAWRKNISGEAPGGAWNLGQGIIDILSTGGYASAGVANKIGQNIAGIQRGELGAVLDLVNPVSGINAAVKGISDRRTYSDNLKEMGVGDDVAPWLGLALDIGLDPLTYVSGGTIAGVKGAAQGAKVASQAAKAGKVLQKTGDAIEAGGALSREQKISNLLTGIARGYETGKVQRAVSIKQNKLERVSRKQLKKLEEVRDVVTINPSVGAKIAADAAEAVGKASEKVTKAQAKAANALPGVTAGLPKTAATVTAAPELSKAIDTPVPTITKTSKGYEVSIIDGNGTIKTSKALIAKTEAAAKAQATKQISKILKDDAEGVQRVYTDIEPAIKAGSRDAELRQNIALADRADRELKRSGEDLAKLSDIQTKLNKVAQSITRGGAYPVGMKPAAEVKVGGKAKPLAKLVDQIRDRVEELRLAELAPLATSATKLEKLTPTEFMKIAKKDPASRTEAESILFDEVAKVQVDIPAEMTELSEAVAVEIARLSGRQVATLEARTGWARKLNNDPDVKKRWNANAKYLADAEAVAVKAAAAVAKLREAGKETGAQFEKAQAALEAANARVGDIRVNGAPVEPNVAYGWITTVTKEPFTADDYFTFGNISRTAEPELPTGAGVPRKPRPEVEPAPKSLKPSEVLSSDDYAEYTNILQEIRAVQKTLPGAGPAAEARLVSLKARRDELFKPTELATIPGAVGRTFDDVVSRGETISGARPGIGIPVVDRLDEGFAEKVSFAQLARLAASGKGSVKAQADDLFQSARDDLAKQAAQGQTEIKGWIDGIVSSSQAGEASIALIRYVAPELEQNSNAFKAAAKVVEDALEGKLKAKVDGEERMLDADEVAEVVEEFLSGNDLAKALDAAGNLDLAKATQPETFNDLSDLVNSLQSGETTLTRGQLGQISRALGVAVDSNQAAKRLIEENISSISAVRAKIDAAKSAKASANEYITKTVNTSQPVSMGHAVEAIGDVNGADVGQTLTDTIKPLEEAQKAIDDVARAVDAGEDVAPSQLAPETDIAFDQFREDAAERFRTVMSELSAMATVGKTTDEIAAGAIDLIRRGFIPDAEKQILQIAKIRGISFEDAVSEAIESGARSLESDPNAKLSAKRINFEQINTEGRYGIYERAYYDTLDKLRKGTPEEIAQRLPAAIAAEATKVASVELLLRAMGIPVRSTENFAARLKRAGVADIADEIPEDLVPQVSNVTWGDISASLLTKGQSDLLIQLRKRRTVGDIKGNFLPSTLEGAWLAIKDAAVRGDDLAKGSLAYENAMQALSTIYKAPKQGVDRMPVEDLFAPAIHTRIASASKAEAAEIAKASEDYLAFLINNADELIALDKQRSIIAVSYDAGPVFERVTAVYKNMLAYAFKLQKVKQASTEAFQRGELEPLYDDMFRQFQGLFDNLNTGGFSDPELARYMADVFSSSFVTAVPGVGRQAHATMLSLKSKLTEDLVRRGAMQGTEPGKKVAKLTPATEKAQKNARRRSADIAITETVADVQKAAENVVDAKAKNPELAENVDVGPFLGEVDDTVALMASVATARLQKTNNGMGDKLMTALSGDYGMGPGIKTIIAGGEMSNFGDVNRYAIGLQAIKQQFRGREDDIRNAFVALQKYKAAELAAIETTTDIAPLEAWLASQRLPVTADALKAVQLATESLFGNMEKLGALSRTGIFAGELNKSIGMIGLAKGGEEGRGFIVAKDSSPDALDYFWTKVSINDMEDLDPLLFLHKAAFAIHTAAARVEIAQQLGTFFGRTAKQIKATGENIADYVKLDPEDDFAKIIGDENLLYPKSIIENFAYAKDYLNYEKTFGDSVLKRVVDVSDNITYVLKSTNTTLRPGHWITTIVGESMMSALAGVKLSDYSKATRILNKIRPNAFNNAEDQFRAYAQMNAARGMTIKASEFDNVYWLSGDKKQIVPDEIIFTLAERYAGIVAPGRSIEDLLAGDTTTFKGLMGKFHRGMDKLSIAAAHRDNFFRMSQFITELGRVKGAKSLEEAAVFAGTQVRKWRPTVSGLSAFERKYARRLIYFYTWQRIALTRIAAVMLEKPGIATIPSKIQYAFAEYNGFNPESFGDPWDPQGVYASYNTGSVFGPQFQGPRGEGDAWGIQPAVQPIDIMAQITRPFTIQPGEDPLGTMAEGASDLFGANLNPVIRTLVESSTKSRLGTGTDLPSPSEYLINQVGVLSTLSKVTGIGQDPNPYDTPQDVEEKNARLIANLLFGQRVQDYSTGATEYRWRMDQMDTIKRLMGTE